MPRQPRGAYVRTTPDRFLARTAIGSMFRASTLGTVPAIGLFNNAVDGSSLHIYALWTFGDAEGPQLWNIQGSATGTLFGPCTAIITGAAGPPGQLWFEDRPGVSGSPLPVDTNYGGYITAGDESGAMSSFTPNGPLCVLKPGYALYCSQFYSYPPDPQQLAVTFYYVWLQDLGED